MHENNANFIANIGNVSAYVSCFSNILKYKETRRISTGIFMMNGRKVQ